MCKPAGLPFHPNLDAARENLVDSLRAWLRGQGHDDYLGIHQRLDKDTSGVVIFALSRAANAPLAAAFEGRRVEKVYHALTRRPRNLPATGWEVSNRLAVVGKKRQARTVSVSTGGQEALTAFRVLAWGRDSLLVEARPRTGRKHQVRAHLAGGGLSLLGDVLYGGPPAPRVMLHAYSLSLPHPHSGEPLQLVAEYPPDFASLAGGLNKSPAKGI